VQIILRTALKGLGTAAVVMWGSGPAWADVDRPHIDQSDLTEMVKSGKGPQAFAMAFQTGEALTSFEFGYAHGVGAAVGDGTMFTRLPRADLDGPGQWAQHKPHRETGVNATSCLSCHGVPMAMGAGELADNILADPGHTGDAAQFLTRNPPSLFALGIPQRLAEEISADLRAQREATRALACEVGAAEIALASKGVSYGTLKIERLETSPCLVEIDNSGLDGIDPDLIIRPFGWKGTQAALRSFVRNAAHNELGLQAIELVGDTDGDYDGMINEMSVGDITAITTFFAALPRPVSSVELADMGLTDMSEEDRRAITAGETAFTDIGCASCHVPSMVLYDPIYSEPARTPGYVDTAFPDGSDPQAHGLSAAHAVGFDLSLDQPDNRIELRDAGIYHLGALEFGADGWPLTRWFTDFKRHDMGPGLADPADPLGMGASVFATRSLAAVGSTGPWLHDGRAMTLTDAILAHGGDAQGVRDDFANLPSNQQDEIIAFLESLQLYRAPDGSSEP